MPFFNFQINLFIICSLFRVMCATRLLAESNTKRKATWVFAEYFKILLQWIMYVNKHYWISWDIFNNTASPRNQCTCVSYKSYCWFVFLVLIVLLINCIFSHLDFNVYSIHYLMIGVDCFWFSDYRTGLRSLCTLLPVLGITWVFGILSINEDLIAFQYLFAVFNSLQVA